MPLSTPLLAVAALAVVLGLIQALHLLARRGWFRAAGFEPAATARLAVTHSLALDARRRLLLIRCDGRELLLLTGAPGGDVVVGWLGAEAAP